MVSAGPTGEVASLAEANEIRIVFSEPMVALGRIPSAVRPAFVTIAPAIPGTFRWSGTTILIFTPDAKTPLPYATRYDVTVDATAAAVSGRTLGAPYTFSFTTPTVKLLRTDAYRRGGRFDAPYIVLLRFNQPVDRADVAAALAAKFESHSWDQPSISAAAQQRLAAIDPTSRRALQRQGSGDQRRGLVHRPGDRAADERLGQEAISGSPDARGVRDGDPRSVAELGQTHTRSCAQVTRRAGDSGPGAGLHPQG